MSARILFIRLTIAATLATGSVFCAGWKWNGLGF